MRKEKWNEIRNKQYHLPHNWEWFLYVFHCCSFAYLVFIFSFTWLQHLKSIVNKFIIVYMKTMDMNSFKRILENGKINDYLQVYRKRGLNISTFHTIGKEWKGNKSYSIDYSVNRGIHVCQSRRFWRMSSTNWKQINCH